MFNTVKKMLGLEPKTDFATLVKNGALVLDVRSPEEYRSGHIKGSVNIPLHLLRNNLKMIKKEKPVITCCASGMRSASAKSILENNGFAQVYNGGGWQALKNKIN
jgi:phage shock protein E